MGPRAITRAGAVGATALLAMTATAGTGVADESADRSAEPATILQEVPAEHGSGVPDVIQDAADRLGSLDIVDSLVWDVDTGALEVYHSGDATALTDPASGLTDTDVLDLVNTGVVDLVDSPYGAQELSEAVDDVIAGESINGADVVWAAPRPDRSGIEVGVRTEPATMPASAEVDGIPVDLVIDGDSTVASRDLDLGEDRIAGASVSRAPSVSCTTGFAFTWTEGGVVEDALLTADHCGTDGDVWHVGRSLQNPELGIHRDVPTAGGDFAGIAGGPAPYGPYVYWGPNDTSEATPVQGSVTPIINASVCYSGAPSGTVCDNTITHTDLRIDYGGGVVYDGIVRTVQDQGTSAVGQGDSGGPVVSISTDGQAHAIGVISGIQNGSTGTCEGEQGGRLCSDVVLFSPVDQFLAENPTAAILTP